MKSQSAADATPAHRGTHKTRSFWRIAAPVLALIAVGGVVAFLHWHRERPQPAEAAAAPHRLRPRQAGPRELAFLAPVAPGKSVQGWTVRGISAMYRGSIRIALDRGHDRVQLTLVKAGSGPPAPAQSGPYAVYYSATQVRRANARDLQALAEALARIASKNRKLEPPGMTTFRQDRRDDDWQ